MTFRRRRCFAFCLALILPLLSLTACAGRKESAVAADYGYYGMRLARRIAAEAPYRAPYSTGETRTRELIREELTRLGYSAVEEQPFVRQLEDGGQRVSANLLVTLPGTGFYADETPAPGHDPAVLERYQGTAGTTTNMKTPLKRREVLVLAHYDDRFAPEEAALAPDYDGIHESAASTAALLVLLRELAKTEMAYDVTVGFLGSGNDSWLGARTLLGSLDAERRARIDCVYVAERIYAGDKLYAHAGQSSLLPDSKYRMRRKLYEATDVAIERRLRAYTGMDLLTNQGGYPVSVPGFAEEHIYREFTLRESDWRPFDEAGIPIVFFESADYNVKSAEAVIESRHPAFSNNGGTLTGSNYDSLRLIEPQVDTSLLRLRINAVAELLLGAIAKGSTGYLAADQAEAEDVDAATSR
ncbi:MAG: M28 family peptidase [Bacillota bacterium]|nr:M28 family peptidase [Bacillota bacterium]